MTPDNTFARRPRLLTLAASLAVLVGLCVPLGRFLFNGQQSVHGVLPIPSPEVPSSIGDVSVEPALISPKISGDSQKDLEPQRPVTRDDLPDPFFAQSLTDVDLLHDLAGLEENAEQYTVVFDRLECLLTEVERRRLFYAREDLRAKFDQWNDPTGKLLIAAYLTGLGDFHAVGHAMATFSRSMPVQRRHYSIWVLRRVWTTTEMASIAADPQEDPSVRRSVSACYMTRQRLERRFAEDCNVEPTRVSDERLRRLLTENTSVWEVVLAELYRREQETK